jgi:hypothetical protein
VRVGFFTVFRHDPQHYVLAEIMVRSVHAQMPGVPVVQFTDETSPPVPGVDSVNRKPGGPLLERRLEHYADCSGDWLLLDTDTLVRRDVRDVFPVEPFDAAFADRAWPHLPQGDSVLTSMPFNTGVAFSRNQALWQRVLADWREHGDTDWLSEQRSVWRVVRKGAFLVRVLPGMVYNYPPKSQKDPCKEAAIVHYKGYRKAWMRGNC